jgi:hypothetical protein
MDWDDRRAVYEEAVERCDGFELKGKSVPYTAVNGHMFSQLSPDGALGIRFSEEVQERYIAELGTGPFTSYGKALKGYVRMPDTFWGDPDRLARFLGEAYEYASTLDPK